MHANNAFCLSFVRPGGGPVLDFGCGEGELVIQGRSQGIDIVGADSFYEAAPGRRERLADRLGTIIFQIENDVLPFEPASFDLIISNQVLEHVFDLDSVARELRRVVRPEGCSVHIFPLRETLRENHCGVPFAHWLYANKTVFALYMSLFYTLGIGKYRKGRSRREWIDHFYKFIAQGTCYRSLKAIKAQFERAGFEVATVEADYMRYRWGRVIMPVFLYRALAGTVLKLSPRPIYEA